MELIEVNFNDEGDIIDTLSGKILKDTPEERVRQRFINILQSDYGYPGQGSQNFLFGCLLHGAVWCAADAGDAV